MVIRRFGRSVALAIVSILAAGCANAPLPTGTSGGGERPVLAPTYRPTGHMAAGDVFVHLFEWKWTDVASECENVLGPAGFKAVQVSPPSEHSLTPNADWSERYQTVSYKLDQSRSGTRAEFIDMVNRCAAVGVGIYVDAVINHMTNFPSPGTGSAGTNYSKYEYPGLYTSTDFHFPCPINDYSRPEQVQECELFGLPDLNTGLSSVRHKIADYLIALARLGVAGYRIDAAKHIQQVELDSIFTIVNTTLTGEGRPIPYVFGEVVDYGGNEAIHAADYYGLGYYSGGASDLTEFRFRSNTLWKWPGGNGAHLKDLPSTSSGPAGVMPSDKAVVFLQNHDTERNDGLDYRDGQVFRLANAWMLAQPYGYPSIISNYAFDRSSDAGKAKGPPSSPGDPQQTLSVTCASSWETATIGQWVCEHRDPYIRTMVGFRHVVAGTDVNHWWTNGADAIAFSRGDKGFFVVNREATALTQTIPTGLAAGTYCDRISGGKSGASCVGASIVIDASGNAAVSMPAMTAMAVDITTKL